MQKVTKIYFPLVNVRSMKYYVRIMLLYLPIGLLFSACQDKQAINYAIVSGIIKNTEGQKIYLGSRDTPLGYDTKAKIEKQIKINELGEFSDTLFINQERNLMLSCKRNSISIRLNPGDHVKVTTDLTNHPAALIYEGNNSIVNTYLHKKALLEKRLNGNKMSFSGENENQFKKRMESNLQEYYKLLNETDGLSDEFIAKEKRDLKIDHAKAYVYYAMLYNRTFGKDAPVLSTDFLNLLSEIDLQDISMYNESKAYPYLVRAYYMYLLSREYDDTRFAPPIKQLRVIKDAVSKQAMKDELFYMFGKYGIGSTQDVQAYYDFFMANVVNETYRTAITEQYNLLIATSPGQPSPEFVNYQNIDGGTNSLSDFRGKYIYIDVWATWCGPCKAQIPYLIEVEKQYHGKNIEFISLSIDNLRNIDKWKKYVKDKKLGGTQLIADKEFASDFVNSYQIKGIPQFILIDPEGKIIDANAPRPSNKKLIDLFNKHGI